MGPIAALFGFIAMGVGACIGAWGLFSLLSDFLGGMSALVVSAILLYLGGALIYHGMSESSGYDTVSSPNQFPDPKKWPDGSIMGVKVLYMDEYGRYVSPYTGDVWEQNEMSGNHVCAWEPDADQMKKRIEILLGETSCPDGGIPVLAHVSLSGDVYLTDRNELIADGNAEIVYVEEL